MKHVAINLDPEEAIRISPRFNKDFVKSRIPITFRESFRNGNGRLFTIVHGIKNNGFVGFDESSLREYVSSHSDLKDDETLYIISCFSSTNELHDPRNKMYKETLTGFPIFLNGVIENTVGFSMITEQEDIKIFAEIIATVLSIPEDVAESFIRGED